jgi:hypothetical protein
MENGMKDGATFTQRDAAGLFHAVRAFDLQVREMAKMDFTPEVIEQERARAKDARAALRKVQALRRAQKKAAKG